MIEKNNDDAVVYKRPRNETIVFRDGKPRMSTKKGRITAAANESAQIFTKRKRPNSQIVVAVRVSVDDFGPSGSSRRERPYSRKCWGPSTSSSKIMDRTTSC